MNYNIVLLPGDGIGQEIINSTKYIFEIINKTGLSTFNLREIPCGGKYYLENDAEWPEGSFEACKQADAILLGAVGYEYDGKPVYTKPGKPYATSQLAGYAPLIANRQKLELYANVRPVKLYPGIKQMVSRKLQQVWQPSDVDFVVVKENTEDAYTGEYEQLNQQVVTPIRISQVATERIVRYACRLARERNTLKKITCVDKSNIIMAHRYFRSIFTEIVKAEFSDLQADYCYADTFNYAQLIKPWEYDVVVAPNLVGDIISEVGAFMQGGLGLAPSGNIGDQHAMFEPIHGSALDKAGRDSANPLAMLMALKMMFEWLSKCKQDSLLQKYADYLEQSILAAIERNILPADLVETGQKFYSCSEITKHIGQIFKHNLTTNLIKAQVQCE